MTDDEIEALLASVRPTGPAPELRARILARRRAAAPAWPWLAAAAALLAAAVGMQVLAGAERRSVASRVPAAAMEEIDADALGAAFGDDAAALHAAWSRRELEALRQRASAPEVVPQ